MKLSLLKWKDAEFWHGRTQLPGIGIKTSNYANELLARMNLSPKDSVLDVGCGDGEISVQLARQVHRVTALDSNPGLLFTLTQKAMAEGTNNLKFVNEDWLETRIGIDIEPHDIVLASRFRQMIPLPRFLEKMDSAANRTCYLTWIAEREESDEVICKLLNREYHPLPEYSIIPNMLRSMGIDAKVDIFEAVGQHQFETMEQAVEEATRGFNVENDDQREKIKSYVENELGYDNGCFYKDTTTKWALIWWKSSNY